MTDHCIVVDIGNTRTSAALASHRRISRVMHIPTRVCAPQPIRRLIGRISDGTTVNGAVVCSVVPSMNHLWVSGLRYLLRRPPIMVDCKLELGLKIDYPKPATIGADRLANACAAVGLYKGPVIVADFGTALTFDVVTADKAYVGGVIAPGLPLMLDYLAERTALLPHIKLPGTFGKVGRSTREAMRIGAKIGYRGMVRETVKYLIKGLRFRTVTLCATGGYAKWALEGIDLPFQFDPYITLRGLRRIYEMNSSRPTVTGNGWPPPPGHRRKQRN